MTFQELQSAMTQAMKDKNRVKKEVIADIITCAKNMAIAQGCKDNITDEIVDAAILKSKKICQEQIDTCPAQRPDILETYNLYMSYINEFAPKMMSEDEVREAVQNLFHENSVTSKGAAMKLAMVVFKGQADGKLVNKIVSEYIDKKL